MVSAMETVKSGTVSINKAALLHLVPRTTLKNHLSGRVVHGTKPGPKPYLAQEEETVLCDHLTEAATKAGYGKIRTQVKLIVESVTKEKGQITFRMAGGADFWRGNRHCLFDMGTLSSLV